MTCKSLCHLVIISGILKPSYLSPEIQIVCQCFLIDIGTVRLFTQPSCTLCQCFCLYDLFIQRFPEKTDPVCFAEIFYVFHLIDIQTFFQPLFWKRMAHRRIIKLIDHLSDLIIGFS